MKPGKYLKLMENLISWYQHLSLRLAVFMIGIFEANFAFADDHPQIGSDDIGAVAQKLQGEGVSVKTFLWTGAQVVGIIIAIIGISMWMKAAKEEGRHSHAKAILLIIIGACGFFLPTVMGVGASSLFSSSSTP